MSQAAAARSFMLTDARELERQVYAVFFDEGDPASVVASLAAFRNNDGGFGNGLEPDKLVPDSQALDVEIAFERLASVKAEAAELVARACDWLATIADVRGAVPVLMPNSNDHPRAAHWSAAEYPPGLNPTAAIVGHAHSLGAAHAWLVQATEYCFATLEAGNIPDEGHELLAVTKFLSSAPDRARASAMALRVASAIKTAAFVKYDADSDAYGVTPLDYAPYPDSFAHDWFPADIIEGHLTALAAAQADDGGWPVAWEPPTADSLKAWRGIRTLGAVTTLRAYGRLT